MPNVDYHRPSPHPDRWQWWRAVDWLAAGCFAAALYCGYMSYVLSHKLATPTPGYRQFVRDMDARAATLPAGAVFERPAFAGQAYVPRPVFDLPTTYLALGFAGAGVALVVLLRRRGGRAG